MDNKGMSLGTLYPAVLTIVLIGIVMGVGLFVLTSTSNAISNTAITVSNETVLLLNGTSADVATADDCGADNFEVVRITNATGGEIITSGNYTFSSTGGLLASITSTYGTAPGTNVNVTYTYDGTSDQTSTGYCGVLDTTNTGLGGLASWIAVIVVVLAAAIVLGIVINSFGRSGGSV